MKLVLEAAPQIKSNYAIIINKVPKEVLLQITNKKQTKKILATLTKGFSKKTKFICFCENNPELSDKNNAVARLEPELVDFIYNMVTPVALDPTTVRAIQYSKFETVQQKLSELKKVTAENSALRGK